MSLFDFAFGLSAVILGLGLAEMASRFQQLVFAGRRVKWAPEPVLLALVLFSVIIVVWLGSWRDHQMHQTTVGQVMLQVASIILPYMVAAAVFPHVREDGALDLHHYYDQNRRFLFGLLLAGQLVFWVIQVGRRADTIQGLDQWVRVLATSAPYYSVVPYAALMFVRWRWFNVAALLLVLLVFAPRAMMGRLVG